MAFLCPEKLWSTLYFFAVIRMADGYINPDIPLGSVNRHAPIMLRLISRAQKGQKEQEIMHASNLPFWGEGYV